MDEAALCDPAMVDELVLKHFASEDLDPEVLENVRQLDRAISFLPIQCVFLAKVYEKAHAEALLRRRQLRRQELLESQRFVGQLAVTVFGVEGLTLPPPPEGFQHIATVCQLSVDKNAQTTTRCTAPTLFWDQEFNFEVVNPCLPFTITVASVVQPSHLTSARTPRSQPTGADIAIQEPAGRSPGATSAEPGHKRPLASPLAKTVVSRTMSKQGQDLAHASGSSAMRRGGSSSSIASQSSQDSNVVTAPIAVASIPLSSLESCKARKISVTLMPAVVSGNDESNRAGGPRGEGKSCDGQDGGSASRGDEQSGQVQLKMHYQYNESYMAHKVPAVGEDFCIGIIGAGGTVGRQVLKSFVQSGLWPPSRIVACTRTASKAQTAATCGVVCTDKYDAAIAGCAVVVLCCRADHLANQVTRSLKGLLAPDTLILTCIQGLALQRQAQLVGVSPEQVVAIGAPPEQTIDQVLQESVLAKNKGNDVDPDGGSRRRDCVGTSEMGATGAETGGAGQDAKAGLARAPGANIVPQEGDKAGRGKGEVSAAHAADDAGSHGPKGVNDEVLRGRKEEKGSEAGEHGSCDHAPGGQPGSCDRAPGDQPGPRGLDPLVEPPRVCFDVAGAGGMLEHTDARVPVAGHDGRAGEWGHPVRRGGGGLWETI